MLLKTKIYLGFAVLALLLVVIGANGYRGVAHLHASSNAMKQISDIDTAVLQIDRDIQELQLRVGRYISSGGESASDQIIALNSRLTREVNETARHQSDPELRPIFDEMANRLPQYQEHFRSVVEDREFRANLVQNEIPAKSKAISSGIDDLRQLTNERDAFRVMLLQVESHFSQAEKQLLRYYLNPDSEHVNKAISNLDAAIVLLESLECSENEEQARTELVSEIKDYQRTGIRAVQATRNYLFLVNVLMAGEASEVAYYSDRLKELSGQRRSSIAREAAETASSVRNLTSTGTAIALIAALLIAVRLAMSVIVPIDSLTRTFETLAAGEHVSVIPECDRKDEIGSMAMAAGIFNEQNQKQKELLIASEKLAKDLKSKANELEVTNTELDSFAYIASHDLKSPLRGIRQLATWILEDCDGLLPEASGKHFQAIIARISRMELLLNDLLSFSRVGRTDHDAEAVSLNEQLHNVVSILDNPNAVRVTWKHDLPVVETYRFPLEQVFLNLISNAIKHNDKGAAGYVEVSCDINNNRAVFKVSDNGPGIAPEHHERVFRMYQRVADSQVDGSGMGLAIVKKQVERLGGQIAIQSESDCGATFIFDWPILSVHENGGKECQTTLQLC